MKINQPDTDETVALTSHYEEFADEPSQPIPYETLAEVSDRWSAQLSEDERAMPSCARPTRNIRPPTNPLPMSITKDVP